MQLIRAEVGSWPYQLILDLADMDIHSNLFAWRISYAAYNSLSQWTTFQVILAKVRSGLT
jgi:hypothetical protein